MHEFGADGVMKWQRVIPPLWWPEAARHVVADRHLPDGTRQHLVEGAVEPGLVIANAQVLGEASVQNVEFSPVLSHLSARS